MKRVIAIVLCMIMIVGNSVIVWADTTVTGTFSDGNWTYSPSGGNTQNVTATYSVEAGKVYSVDIMWGSLQYEYEATGTWKTNSNSYDWNITKDWTCAPGANEIKLVNHSNASVSAQFDFTPGSVVLSNYGIETLTGNFASTKNSDNADNTLNTSLASAEGTQYYSTYEDCITNSLSEITDKMTLTLTSSLPTKTGTSPGGETVGTVKITLSN